jgi:uncharacterized protein YecE (DUF72 family)
MGKYTVYSGAVGWEHSSWLGDFYPEDLPDEWQLSFYNTQFRCVYLPYELWSNASGEDIDRWLNETQEGFRFVLQVLGEKGEISEPNARRFGVRGILDDQADVLWLEGKLNLRDLAQRIQTALNSGIPVHLISRDGDLAQLKQVSELMALLCV